MSREIEAYYLAEQDEGYMEERERELKRILEEHEQEALKPYFDLMHGKGVRPLDLPAVVNPIIDLYRAEGSVFFREVDGQHLLFYEKRTQPKG